MVAVEFLSPNVTDPTVSYWVLLVWRYVKQMSQSFHWPMLKHEVATIQLVKELNNGNVPAATAASGPPAPYKGLPQKEAVELAALLLIFTIRV